MYEIDQVAVNNRLIENEKFVHRKLAKPIKQLLSIDADQFLDYPVSVGSGWLVNGEPIEGELTGFSGVIDLETTGLIGIRDKVICAVGIGFIADELVVVIHGNCDRLPIKYSTVFNHNQPFDRSFYLIENGKDTNAHIDTASLAKMVLGEPGYNQYGFNSYISLANLYEYFFHEELDKSDREKVIDGSLSLLDTVRYCLRDVVATVKTAQKIIPRYTKKNPSPISLNGIKLRSFSIPISNKFNGWVDKVDSWFQAQLDLLQVELDKSAITSLTSNHPSHNHLFAEYPKGYKTDKTAMKAAITLPESELKQELIKGISEGNERARNELLFKVARRDVSFSSGWVAMLVAARYQGLPLLFSRKYKVWNYGENTLLNTENPKAALLTPFSKGYFNDEQLTSDISEVRSILRSIQTWISFQGRFKEVTVDEYGYHHATYTPAHTLTGRSVDKLFLLCPKPKEDKGGSEFMKFIEAKPGYKIVTADFDSAELIYASHLANFYLDSESQLGCDFSEYILNGDTAKKTDIHSVVATMLGIDRGAAKNLVYGANYGQGKEARREMIMKVTGCNRKEANRLANLFEEQYIGDKAKPVFEATRFMAEMDLPTPLLLSELPDGLLDTGSDHFTTKNNRVIQALGTDHLNILITDVERQIEDLSLDATLILTRHDECLYEVLESHTEAFKTAIQSAHRFSVECLLSRLGIRLAVERWLNFSSVDAMDYYCQYKFDDGKEIPYPITCTELYKP